MAIPPLNPQNRTTPANADSPTATVPTSGGVGDAPTTLNSASQPQQNAQSEGYIVPFLNWVCGWISWIFRKIFCCGSPAASPAAPNQPGQDSPAPSAAPSDGSRADRRPSTAAPQATLTTVREELNRELELLRRFHSRDNTEQALILRRIGQESHRTSRLNTWGYFLPFETIGRRAVDRNPLLLEGYV